MRVTADAVVVRISEGGYEGLVCGRTRIPRLSSSVIYFIPIVAELNRGAVSIL